MTIRFLITVFLLSFGAKAWGQIPGLPGFGDDGTVAEVISEATEVEPGDYFQVALKLGLQPHFHAYFQNPGSLGTAPLIKWTLPEGFTGGETEFPLPQAITSEVGGQPVVLYGYEGEVVFLYQVSVDEGVAPGTMAEVKGVAEWQVCDDQGCFPESHEFSFQVKVGEATVMNPARVEFFEKARARLAKDGTASWIATAVEEDDVITLTVKVPAGVEVKKPVEFFSLDQQIDSQAEYSVETGKERIVFSLPRNQGTEKLGISAAEVRDTMSGVVTFVNEDGQRVGYEILGSLQTSAVAAAGRGSGLGFLPATAEERAAGAKVYDPEARPERILLTGREEKKETFWSVMPFIFLGGLILNLMPCVFPVLGIKVMGFVEQAGEDRRKVKIHGLTFTLGLLIAMWILASVIMSLKLNWGDQMTNPTFLAGVIILFLLLALNLYGVFEIGTSLTGVGGELQSKKGYSGSFFSGILTTLVATPCSGPFLGSSMAFALSQPPAKAFLIFTVFGLGIAFPYLFLSFFPALIAKLPRPGNWMVSFKQIMAFFVMAAAVFFMGSYQKLVGPDHFNLFLFALLLIGLGAYFYGRWGIFHTPKVSRLVNGFALGGLMIVGGFWWAFSTAKPPKPGLAWKEWYPGIMEVSRPEGRIVWVDYTADWCATCILNKKRVFSDQKVLDRLEELNVLLIKADNTERVPEIATDLKRYGRSGLPTNVVAPADPNAPVILMPEVFGPDDALQALEMARTLKGK